MFYFVDVAMGCAIVVLSSIEGLIGQVPDHSPRDSTMSKSYRRPIGQCGEVTLSVEASASSKAALGSKGRDKHGDKKVHQPPKTPSKSTYKPLSHRVSCGDSRMDMWHQNAHQTRGVQLDDEIEHRPITGAWRRYQANTPLAKAQPSKWKVVKL